MQQVEQNRLYINCDYICATKRAICLTLADVRENIQENMRNNGKYDLLAMTCVLFTRVAAKQKCSRWVCCEGPQGFFDLSAWNRLSCDRSKRLLLLLQQRPQRTSDIVRAGKKKPRKPPPQKKPLESIQQSGTKAIMPKL